jgi:hypothetical protein
MASSDRPPAPEDRRSPSAEREPATAVLPDLTDLFDRRIDPQRREDHDRRTLPEWALPSPTDEDESETEADSAAAVAGMPTYRFDRGRRGFAAVVARPLGRAAVLSSPLLVTGATALVANMVLGRFGASAVSIAMLALLALQVAGLAFAREVAYAEWSVVWLVMLVALGVFTPLLALQALFGGEPFVSLRQASASPFVASTFGVVVALLGVVVGVALLCLQEPERASVLFVPAATIGPALLGMSPEEVIEGVLSPLGTTLLAAGAWSFLVWLAPKGIWLLSAPVALAVELILLLLFDGGPRAGYQAGMMVTLAYAIVLGLIAAAAVGIPFLARWFGRLAGELTR